MRVALLSIAVWSICHFVVGATINTVAGSGKPENNGAAGKATDINVGQPFGVGVGPDGAV